jgi:WD40 repeat protein
VTKSVRTLKGHSSGVTSVSFSPDGRRIVSGSSDKTVKVWDAQTGQETLTFKGDSTYVLSVSFSPDGKRIVSGGYDSTVKVWDAQTGQETFTLKGHSDGVTSVSFSPDGKRIVSGSGDKTVKVWDAQTGQEMLTLRAQLQVPAAAANPSSNTLAVISVSFSPDGKRIVSGDGDPTYGGEEPVEIKVWDAQTGQETLTLKGHTGHVNSVSFSPDGKRIVSGGGRRGKPRPPRHFGEITVWDAATGLPLPLLFKGHSDTVQSVSFSPDGKRIVSSSFETVKVCDAQTGKETLTLKGHSGTVYSVSFSPDGKWIVSGGGDHDEPGEIKIWDISSLATSP